MLSVPIKKTLGFVDILTESCLSDERYFPRLPKREAPPKVLGRLASEIAARLRGKHKPEFTPHVDTGDYIVVINADKIVMSAEKAGKKTYYRHTGYPGGVYETTFVEMQAKHPGRALEIAVKGMLPKGPLGRQMMTKLHVYAGAEHNHQAQKPETLTF